MAAFYSYESDSDLDPDVCDEVVKLNITSRTQLRNSWSTSDTDIEMEAGTDDINDIVSVDKRHMHSNQSYYL